VRDPAEQFALVFTDRRTQLLELLEDRAEHVVWVCLGIPIDIQRQPGADLYARRFRLVTFDLAIVWHLLGIDMPGQQRWGLNA
jgi:hypothetical protein